MKEVQAGINIWDGDDIRQLHSFRTELLMSAGRNEGVIPLSQTREPQLRLLAAFSLVQDGFIELSETDMQNLALTPAGIARLKNIQKIK